jgi:hypothetical protein
VASSAARLASVSASSLAASPACPATQHMCTLVPLSYSYRTLSIVSEVSVVKLLFWEVLETVIMAPWQSENVRIPAMLCELE